MDTRKITDGVYWVEIPEANLYILCGCPADSVKHMSKRGLIVPKEKNGVQYETGPNAILLSDVSIQNGRFSNLAEFPVLQMFYRQGMILPGHPNNTGIRPLLIGLEDQVYAQSLYIYRGNYGLTSIQEILDTGVSTAQANEFMRLKMKFAFDKIQKTEELIDFRIIEKDAVELREGVFIHRKGVNVYEFLYNNSSTTVDLNLSPDMEYPSAYHLDSHCIGRDDFSIIHTGEGDGWDENHPCMASILTFKGKMYLIDAGPNITHSLTALGISVNEIEGVFHTHAHDDHFAGLPTLIRSDHRIKYLATPLVKSSVLKKFEVLTGINERRFKNYFQIQDLEFDKWNHIGELEVKPVFSPHPVETSILYFRAPFEGTYKTYAHLADIASFAVLEGMVTDNPQKSGITRKFVNNVKKRYHDPVDLKKIDIGGGYIHGMAQDFVKDRSTKLILAHTSMELTDEQKEIGSSASFGMEDVLIPASDDYFMKSAKHYLGSYFLDASRDEIESFLKCPLVVLNGGSIIIKRGTRNKELYLVLSGLVEVIDSKNQIHNTFCAGSLVGEWCVLTEEPCRYTYRTKSYVRALRIPQKLYLDFIKKKKLYETAIEVHEKRRFLRGTKVFGDIISCYVENWIAQVMTDYAYKKGEYLDADDQGRLFLVESGEVEIMAKDRIIETITAGDFYGEERIYGNPPYILSARVAKNSKMKIIPGNVLKGVPVVQLTLLERLKKRMNLIKTGPGIEWGDEFSMKIKELDEQHKALFQLVNEFITAPQKQELKKIAMNIINHTKRHFEYEEGLMQKYRYPDFQTHKKEHEKLLRELKTYHGRLNDSGKILISEIIHFLKSWLVKHTLTVDRKYINLFHSKGLS
ncbi:MAG: bacteriohemerythrin [Spirochaetota bacterium]|nr:MAG: bacteriohemerythrin [Spirochaetota bacterium]